MGSFRSYWNINDTNDPDKLQARRKTIKRLAIISLSSIVLIGVIVAAAVGTTSSKNGKQSGDDQPQPPSASMKAVCDVTLYPDTCYSSLSPMLSNSSSQTIQPQQLFKLSIEVAMMQLSKLSEHFFPNSTFDNDNIPTVAALKDCHDLFGLAMDHLNTSFYHEETFSGEAVDDLKTWLSSAGTYLETCIDGFNNATEDTRVRVHDQMKNPSELVSNSLAILTGISKVSNYMKLGKRRLMGLSSSERRLLQSSDLKMNANAVVAKDGSGKYNTISAALKAVPDNSNKRFVIYVKKGVYYENVRVEKSKWNVVMVGDGMDATVVSGKLNFVDGTPTFSSATFAVFGKGFMARDMGFRNTAGPSKHQAVALMSTSDQSVFYRCRIDAFQDSLYANSNRQFYRDCNIFGTVDFIFGNSAVVLQNCNILPKQPMQGQQNTITAQGRIDPNQNTGITIHNCTIWPSTNLTSVRTYLGRPWKAYSRTIYMSSTMGSFIDPSGWLPWTGTTAPNTIFYSEFQNFGPGSSTKNRVKWKGLRTINAKQADTFTVKSFIQGNKWIQQAGVPYKSGL